MARQTIIKLLEKATKIKDIHLEIPENPLHGDYSTNIALKLKKNPKEIAAKLKSPLFEKVEVAGSGFINFFLSKDYLQKQVAKILKEGKKFGELKIGKKQKVNIEFISANPTGPLHVGNARGGFCGDTLANVLSKAGYKSFREYYVNDRGRQIKFLKDTLEGNIVYKNEYTDDLIKEGEKNVNRAVKKIVKKIKETVRRMGINFDRWFYENELYDKEVNNVLTLLKEKKLIYEKDGALWFQSTRFGDDKDRVLVRTQDKTTHKEETYFLSDIAYLKNKFERRFSKLVIFLGAEHHGYTQRLKAAAQALGYNHGQVEPVVMQLVKLLKQGKEVKMSKRAGVYITIDDLLKEVKNDVSRFFFLMRSYGNHLLFDLDLAKKQSEQNPVYYVQYAHARICSILRKFSYFRPRFSNLQLLTHVSELALIKQLIRFPEIVEDTAKDYHVQRIPQYALDLATKFHQFYRDCRVISKDKNLTQARLNLVSATKTVLRSALDLMGIFAPEKM